MYLMLVFIGCLAVAVHPLASPAQARPFPRCLEGFCLEVELPTEETVRSRFGGVKQPVFLRDFIYCYNFVAPQESSYGHFLLNDFGSGLRVVAISLSREPIGSCANAHTVKIEIAAPLSTKEGVRLNSNETEVLEQYGRPKFALRPPPPEVVKYFLGESPKAAIDAIIQYVDDLSTARFYISDGHVVGIEISISS